jgi:hypothetical protein
VLVDRDLLALRTAAANVSGPPPELRHTARPRLVGATGAIVALPPKEPVAVTAALLAEALDDLAPGSVAVLHGRAVDAGRVLDLIGRHRRRPKVLDRRGRDGAAAVRVSI